jgi:uncharacterized protein
MSQNIENVEVVRAGFEAWSAGDMDALRELHDADAIVRPAEGWPEPGPFVGREAVMRWYEQLRETFDINAVEEISDTRCHRQCCCKLHLAWHGARP